MKRTKKLLNEILSSRKWTMMLMMASALIWTSCDPDDVTDPDSPQPLSILSITANNQALADGAENIARVDLVIEVVFSNSLDTEAFSNAFSMSSADGLVGTSLSFSDSDSKVTITTDEPLGYLETYTLSIESGELGANGNELEEVYSLSFTTVDAVLFSGGEGTVDDPYRIEDAADLSLIKSYLEAHFIQIADIDLTGAGGETGWEPIGSDEFPFTGTYDGDGFSINNLEITNLVADLVNNVGLFGVVEGAVISNMHVNATNTGVTGTQGNGILIGQLRSGEVTNCHTSGFVSGDTRTGGLIGDMESGSVHQCSSSATVSPERSRAGGLIGIMSDSNREGATETVSTLSESFATGNVTSGSSRVGGLVGSVNTDATISNSYSTGNVSAPNRGGSILGWLAGTMTNSYGTGNVTITDEDDASDYPGYAIGELRSSGVIENVYYDSNLNLTYNGASPITEAGESVDISGMDCSDAAATLAGLDFSAVWSCENGAWPNLTWEN